MNYKKAAVAALVLVTAVFAAAVFFSLRPAAGRNRPAATSGTAATTARATQTQPETAAETTTQILPGGVRVLPDTGDGSFTVGFTGDINLDETWDRGPMQYCAASSCGIADYIGADLIEKMRSADILFVNNECSISTRGSKQAKAYAFRADPANISVYKALGVDAVTLANNHIYDYGAQGLLDTVAALEKAGIACAGAGADIGAASQAAYFRINGKTVAFVAAGRTESWFNTPAAGEDSPGILDAYGSDNCVRAIRTAAAQSDYVIVYVHWGTEDSHHTSAEQLAEGERYIEAGADAVIGSHPHVLQGMNFYRGKFIAYSLGNFWFNLKDLESAYLELTFDAGGGITPRLTPCMTSGGHTIIETDAAKAGEITALIESVSPKQNVYIAPDGTVKQK